MAKKQRRMIQIRMKSGAVLDLLPSSKVPGDMANGGSLWQAADGKNFTGCGYIHNGIWNFTHVDVTWSRGGYAVSKAILTFAKRLGIKKLRIEIVYHKLTLNGFKYWHRYGYVASSKFGRLAKKRKTVEGSCGRCVLLKKSDLVMKGE